MLHFPVLRWGQPYTSLDVQEVSHFLTGEPLARVSQANPGLLVRDMKQAQRARDLLRQHAALYPDLAPGNMGRRLAELQARLGEGAP